MFDNILHNFTKFLGTGSSRDLYNVVKSSLLHMIKIQQQYHSIRESLNELTESKDFLQKKTVVMYRSLRRLVLIRKILVFSTQNLCRFQNVYSNDYSCGKIPQHVIKSNSIK